MIQRRIHRRCSLFTSSIKSLTGLIVTEASRPWRSAIRKKQPSSMTPSMKAMVFIGAMPRKIHAAWWTSPSTLSLIHIYIFTLSVFIDKFLDSCNNGTDDGGYPENWCWEVKNMHVISDECVKCGACASTCPTGAIEEGETKYVVTDSCIDCGACESACPTGAISAE